MGSLAAPASVTYLAHLGEGHLVQAFDAAVATRGLAHVRRRHVPMRAWTLDELDAPGCRVEASADTVAGRLALLSLGEREVVELVAQHGAGQVRAAADDPDEADALVERFCELLREHERPEDQRVAVWFWTLTEHGPQPLRRRLHAPTWDDIADNYASPARESLERIMRNPPATAQGIALWRGAPGTGKTTALRALAREWRGHADVHVIVDPEVFLGDKASYLVEVLFGSVADEPWEQAGAVDDYPDAGTAGGMLPSDGALLHEEAVPAAKLIVLEDAGELISAEARISAGQALSRLLNLTDGMLGQGSNVSVLVTTNEPIDRLHPAIARPGRGWSHLEFPTLPAEDANRWLARHDLPHQVEASASIAELYALLRGDEQVSLDVLAE